MEGSCGPKPWDRLRELGCLADTDASSSTSCSGGPWEHLCTACSGGPYADHHTQIADGSGDGVVELAQRNAIHRQCLAAVDGGDDGEAMVGNKYADLHADSAHGMVHQVLSVVASFHVVAGDVAAGEDGDDEDL